MFRNSSLRVIPYLRVNNGCHIMKESVPVTVYSESLLIHFKENLLAELESYFSDKELNRFSNLLYKLSLFKRKYDHYNSLGALSDVDARLLKCLRRLNLLKFDNLPQLNISDPSIKTVAIDAQIPQMVIPKPFEHPPKLPALKLDSHLVFLHPKIIATCPVQGFDRNQLSSIAKENQRLEFYGDSVLGEVAARAILERFPNASDGLLTGIKGLLVLNDTLIVFAHVVGLPKLLEKYTNGGSYHGKVLADCFESYVGQTKVEGGESLKEMTICLLKLLEPLQLRIQENLNCQFGTTELKVDEVLCDWFGLDDDVRLAIQNSLRKQPDATRKKIASNVEISLMKDFAKISPSLSFTNSNRFNAGNFSLNKLGSTFNSTTKFQPPALPKISKLARELKSEARPQDNGSNKVIRLLTNQISRNIIKKLHKNSKAQKANKILRRENLRDLLRSIIKSQTDQPRIKITRRKKRVICAIVVADSLVYKGVDRSISRSKRKLIRNFWTHLKPEFVQHYGKDIRF